MDVTSLNGAPGCQDGLEVQTSKAHEYNLTAICLACLVKFVLRVIAKRLCHKTQSPSSRQPFYAQVDLRMAATNPILASAFAPPPLFISFPSIHLEIRGKVIDMLNTGDDVDTITACSQSYKTFLFGSEYLPLLKYLHLLTLPLESVFAS